MNDQPDIDRALRAWFGDGPAEMPDRVLDIVVDRIARQPQRHAWRLQWRLPVNAFVKLAAAVAAVAIVAVVSWNLLPGRSGGDIGVGVAPTPTASPSASPSQQPSPSLCATSDPSCTGALAPGIHSTDALITPISYAVPAGWSKPLDVPGSVNLTPDAAVGIIAVWPDWNIAKQDSCAAVREEEPGMGRTPDDLVAWIAGHEGVEASSPAPITIGGLQGVVVDVGLKPGWTGSCGRRAYLFTHKGTIGDNGGLEVLDRDRMRLAFVDVGGGHVVNVAIIANDAVDFDSFVAAATPVVESIVFE